MLAVVVHSKRQRPVTQIMSDKTEIVSDVTFLVISRIEARSAVGPEKENLSRLVDENREIQVETRSRSNA